MNNRWRKLIYKLGREGYLNIQIFKYQNTKDIIARLRETQKKNNSMKVAARWRRVYNNLLKRRTFGDNVLRWKKLIKAMTTQVQLDIKFWNKQTKLL